MIAAALLLVLVQASVLFWRRTQPVGVLLVVILTVIVSFAIAPDREPTSPALAFAVYAVSVYDRGRARLVVVAAAIVLVICAVVLLFLNGFGTARVLLPPGAMTLIRRSSVSRTGSWPSRRAR